MYETLNTKTLLLLDAQLPKQVAIPKTEIAEKLEILDRGLIPLPGTGI